MKLIATMSSGFESVTAKELQDLGYQTKTENGKVYFDGENEDIAKTNLWLRSADRIKILIGTFKATSFEELFDKVYAIDWDNWLPLNAAFPIKARTVKSKLHSERDIQAITKKAIVNKMADVFMRRGRLPETGAKFQIETRIHKDMVEVTLDTTGESLYKRGYRVEHGAAPLKENFAAAMILLTVWHPEEDPFLDPTTGSGTIAIEAARLAKNIAPGIKRHFLFENFDWFDPKILENLKEAAVAGVKKNLDLDIRASDIDGSMIDVAKLNAHDAGVLHDIKFKQIAVKDLKIEGEFGTIISNPPYGQRMSDMAGVRKLYKEMGEVFSTAPTWNKYILTSDTEFEKYYGELATKKRKLYNGSLRTDMYQYWAKH
ncbi:class I SAM-dependent RNA methyltransferase [Companilactobacillus suantsaicola]|uniref:Class I SAM-dependent RNA methyltransferase n=1 Tax=Companilactobacillus suantsaicola TaxID=2487723 RepID=A0A4Z0JQY3_9LACO|nr:class I SAM-dependent RNA methyltransferase [Companilactobacillus suantsaicola]TGD24634.1 class I SAM-dependent RNA methyltransferase [Companilactobacillus suantsaicola]